MAFYDLKCKVNGREVQVTLEADQSLNSFLRDTLGLTGTKLGCGSGDCGACTVLVDGKNVNSCIYPAVAAEGKEIVTIEGLSEIPEMQKLQQIFVDKGAVQCGFCSPGMLTSIWAMLQENPHPTEEEIRRGISGNLCRCTGYQAIVDAVLEYTK